MSPKRSVFSLNIDSNTEHYHQQVSEPNHADGTKVVEINGPTHGHKNISYISKPFEKAVNHAVDDVLQDSGKKAHSVQGEIHTKSPSTQPPLPRTTSPSTYTGTLNIKNKSTRRFLERNYDTSEV